MKVNLHDISFVFSFNLNNLIVPWVWHHKASPFDECLQSLEKHWWVGCCLCRRPWTPPRTSSRLHTWWVEGVVDSLPGWMWPKWTSSCWPQVQLLTLMTWQPRRRTEPLPPGERRPHSRPTEDRRRPAPVPPRHTTRMMK